MAEVLVRLKNFDTEQAAERVADDIRNAGSINYKTTGGGDVNVTVGDVTVEQA